MASNAVRAGAAGPRGLGPQEDAAHEVEELHEDQLEQLVLERVGVALGAGAIVGLAPGQPAARLAQAHHHPPGATEGAHRALQHVAGVGRGGYRGRDDVHIGEPGEQAREALGEPGGQRHGRGALVVAGEGAHRDGGAAVGEGPLGRARPARRRLGGGAEAGHVAARGDLDAQRAAAGRVPAPQRAPQLADLDPHDRVLRGVEALAASKEALGYEAALELGAAAGERLLHEEVEELLEPGRGGEVGAGGDAGQLPEDGLAAGRPLGLRGLASLHRFVTWLLAARRHLRREVDAPQHLWGTNGSPGGCRVARGW
jgi:hypothetical protein